jgi:hypothetical protein
MPQINWYSDLDRALEAAHHEHKQVLLDFFNPL